jgi:hypothetical protein
MVYAIVTNHYKVLPSTKVTKGGFLGGGGNRDAPFRLECLLMDSLAFP